MASVEVIGLRKGFNNVPVLKELDLAIADGEFVVLLGPSGCGKSTLLRIIAGLEEADAGSVMVAGEDVSDLEPRDRGVAMVFQSYALYPHKTVGENMGFALKMAGTARAEISRKTADVARMLELTDYLDRYPRQLSGGQRQRVAMGRAIVRAPKVFLFDEPLSNLCLLYTSPSPRD